MRGMVSALTLAACVAAPSMAHAQEAVSDPWEGFNRDLYAVHDSVDQAVLEPVARGYRAITPRPVRTGVLNFLRNLRGPVIFANDVLQGEIARAGTTAARFGLNTTIGIAGVFDPATSFGLERHDEDFGQTLAVWGVDSGPYIFVPLLGPTTLRDGAGRIIDTAFDPFTWLEGEDMDTVRISRTVLAGVSAREQVIETVDNIRRDSVDPYVTIRTSWSLLRESAIQNGADNVQDLPEFEAIDEQPATETMDTPETAPDATQTPADGSVTPDGSVTSNGSVTPNGSVTGATTQQPEANPN